MGDRVNRALRGKGRAVDLETLFNSIRGIPDFPKKGILFRDITTLLKDPACLSYAISVMKEYCAERSPDTIVGIESRGFIFGSILAHELGMGFVPVRKLGKLPAPTAREPFELEYGTDALEVHVDAIVEGHRLLVVDDLLATGGTAAATVRLIERLGGNVAGVCVLVELSYLDGRASLAPHDVFSLIRYDKA